MRAFLACVFLVALTELSPDVLRAQSPLPAVAPPAASLTPPPPVAPPAVPPTPSAHRPVVPLPPIDLLTLLPKTPDKWQIKQSQASNSIMIWVSAQAIREFNYTPPHAASVNPGDPPPPPLVLRVTIIDTGYYQGLIGDFEKAPPTKPGAMQYLTLGGFPARQSPMGTSAERLRVLVNSRYVVQIDVQNQPINSSQQWLRIIDLAKVAALPAEGSENLPRPYTITRIDEINPQNNSTSQVVWGTKEELERAARRRR